MIRRGLVSAVLVGFAVGSPAAGQDTSETKKLKDQVATLEAKLKRAEQKVEKLTKEVEELRGQATGQKEGKKSLSDLLPEGQVLTGSYRSTAGNTVKGNVTVTIKERDGNKVKGTWLLKDNNRAESFGEVALEGEITINQMTLKHLGASRRTLVVNLKGERLEGTWVVHDLNIKGVVVLEFPK